MSAEKEKLAKIAQSIERKTSIKDKEKILGIAQAVDDFAGLILQSYLAGKALRKK